MFQLFAHKSDISFMCTKFPFLTLLVCV